MKLHTTLNIINALWPGLWDIISLQCKGVLRGFFLVNRLASIDNLTSINQETEHIQTQTLTQKWP